MTSKTSKIRNPNIRLHSEIIDFYNYIAPTKEDNSLRVKAIEKIRAMIEEKIPGTTVQPFGSFVT